MGKLEVISLGWGVQSFGLAAMSALGVLPKVDVAVHADTGHERAATYLFARQWTPWLEEHGIRVVTVRPDDAGVIDRWGGVRIPVFSETGGQLRRQCTFAWKVAPIRRWVREHCGQQIELWLGITLDEMRRVRPSGVRYMKHRFPYLEMEFWGGHAMRRVDVVAWLRKTLGDEAVPQRSRCVFCPFQRLDEWARTRRHPGDWARALEADRLIRHARLPGKLYLVPQRVPLDELRGDAQLEIWDRSLR